ncbi:hypothetical protein, partial [Streptomyces hydrogenans]|uniref:hypothetical protein n=1 Tax=Streptomyces hydrogenans TaxID=1873719 RepID=UPI003328D253
AGGTCRRNDASDEFHVQFPLMNQVPHPLLLCIETRPDRVSLCRFREMQQVLDAAGMTVANYFRVGHLSPPGEVCEFIQAS